MNGKENLGVEQRGGEPLDALEAAFGRAINWGIFSVLCNDVLRGGVALTTVAWGLGTGIIFKLCLSKHFPC